MERKKKVPSKVFYFSKERCLKLRKNMEKLTSLPTQLNPTKKRYLNSLLSPPPSPPSSSSLTLNIFLNSSSTSLLLTTLRLSHSFPARGARIAGGFAAAEGRDDGGAGAAGVFAGAFFYFIFLDGLNWDGNVRRG